VGVLPGQLELHELGQAEHVLVPGRAAGQIGHGEGQVMDAMDLRHGGTVYQAGRVWAEKNDHSTEVASMAVLGSSSWSTRLATGLGGWLPGHWWPAPSMVISVTVVPCAPSAASVCTAPC